MTVKKEKKGYGKKEIVLSDEQQWNKTVHALNNKSKRENNIRAFIEMKPQTKETTRAKIKRTP